MRNTRRKAYPGLTSCVFLSPFLVLPVLAFDFPDVEGWEPAGEMKTYGPANLWEAIDGAADALLSYGFKELRSRDLRKGNTAVTLELYEMASPLGAFGIFASEKPRGEEWLPIGVGAVVSPPYQCAMAKGPFYVKVSVYEGKVSQGEGEALLEQIAKLLPGASGLPRELSILPVESMIPHSQGYAGAGFLGLSELSQCIWARYADRYGKEYRLFFMLPSDVAPAESTWAILARSWKVMHHGIHTILSREVPYTGLVGVVRTEKGIYGVADSKNELDLVMHLERFLD